MHNHRLIKIIILSMVIFGFISHSNAWAKRPRGTYRGISARSAIFSNATAVKRYYGKDVHARVAPASTTKVMTALLVLEHLDLNQVVTVGAHAVNIQPSTIDLKIGEQFKVRDLLLALLLNSANDASIALAEAVSGTQEKFVDLMNSRAKEIGCLNTHYTNSNGLPENVSQQYTSAYDMYLVFRQAIRNDFFRHVLKMRYAQISSLQGRRVFLKSHNKILLKNWKEKVYGKTGYTKLAKQCFVGFLNKGDDICIIAVYGCRYRWQDIKFIIEHYGGIDL